MFLPGYDAMTIVGLVAGTCQESPGSFAFAIGGKLADRTVVVGVAVEAGVVKGDLQMRHERDEPFTAWTMADAMLG